jgi:hypothetical protein
MRAAVTTAAICLACIAGCKRSAPVPGSNAPAPAAPADARVSAAGPTPPPISVGVTMKAAFAPLDARAAKTLAAGHAAYRAKKYREARVLFQQVVAAHPDHTAARFQELRAAVRAGDTSEVANLWRELLVRDCVAHATKLDAGAEFASLRASALWPDLVRVRSEVKTAYAQGLGRGLFFVARSRPAKPQLWDEKARPVLELFQEAYHFDPASGRVRRLTDSGGQVFGILADRARKQLVLLLVQGLAQNDEDSGWSFLLFKASVLSLDTLDVVGPVEVPNAGVPVPEVVMCVSPKGAPLWVAGASYAFDAAGKALAKVPETCAAGTGVRVTTRRGENRRSLPPGTSQADCKTLTITGSPEIRRETCIRSESIGWSPGKTRLLFSGELDPCDLEMRYEKKWPRSAQNELLVWDVAAKRSSRVASAFSFFEWDWLDDDHLAYETGPQSNPRVAVHEFSTGTDTIVETRAGAGLVAVPSLVCVFATVEGPDDDDGAE